MGSNRKRGWKENSGWTDTRDVKSRISLKIGARIDGILSHNRGWKKQRRTMATDFSSGWYAVYFVQKFSLFPVGKGIHRTTIVRGTNWYLDEIVTFQDTRTVFPPILFPYHREGSFGTKRATSNSIIVKVTLFFLQFLFCSFPLRPAFY